jgi:dihydrofolate synthase / folylpolyglutamate synthase
MNYKETTTWLFNKLPMYQMQGSSAYKKDLTNTILLANHLGNPEKKLKCIHVAGTNGKGSTCHFLASILQEAGYKVGLYTSPHLKDFRERIKINGVDISEEFVTEFVKKNKNFFDENDLSFFEMTVGLAFEYFLNQKTDINIIEVGLGGRLDSTNIITPLVSVITNIGLDHTQFLGTTLQSIGYEKAGIIKPNVPVVIGEYTEETKPVFVNKASENNSEIYFASELVKENYPSDLQGDYQKQNKKTVIQTIRILQKENLFTISEKDIVDGLINTVKNTKLLGRWQQLQENPKVICDTAHNSHGLKIVLNQLLNLKFKTLHIILGVVNDKDLDEILPLFPSEAIYYFCRPNIPRGLDGTILMEFGRKYNLKGNLYNSVSEAYCASILNADENDLIFVGGSTFVVAEIL